MEKQKIYLDTNIVRRYLENDKKIIDFIKELKHENQFIIHEFALFEICDFIDRNNSKEYYILENKLRSFLHEFDIEIDKITKDLDGLVKSFVDYGMFGVQRIKWHILHSFVDYISQIYGNIIGIIYSEIYNQNRFKVPVGVGDYVKHESDLNNANNIKNRYKEAMDDVIKKAYIQNRKVGNVIKLFLKDFLINLIAVYLESEKYGLNMSDDKYEMIISELNYKYKGVHFKDILKEYIDTDTLHIYCVEGTDCQEFEFYNSYIHKLFDGTGRYELNDLTDYKIFISAFRNGSIYLTNDTKALNLYEFVFKENENIISFISRSRIFAKKLNS